MSYKAYGGNHPAQEYKINSRTIPPTYAAKKNGIILVIRPVYENNFFNERVDYIIKIINKSNRVINFDETKVTCKWDDIQDNNRIPIIAAKQIKSEILSERSAQSRKATFYAFASGYVGGMGDQSTANFAMRESKKTTEVLEINTGTSLDKLKNTQMVNYTFYPGEERGGVITMSPLSGLGTSISVNRILVEIVIEYNDDLASEDPSLKQEEMFYFTYQIQPIETETID